jgi:peptide methionine sulfoxide reductase MsrA
MDELNKNTYDNQIVTQVQPAQKFWIAEEHHQNFYMQNASKPYCQIIIDPKIKKLREGFEGWLKI